MSAIGDTCPIALAGTWCAPGIREGGGDLPPWYERHGPEGARQAGMPGGTATAYRRWPAAEADGAPYVRPLEYLVARDVCPAEWATDTGRGRRPKALRRLMPRDQAGSMNHPIIKLDWWSRPSRLPDCFKEPDAKAGVAMMERAPYSPTPLLPYSPTPLHPA